MKFLFFYRTKQYGELAARRAVVYKLTYSSEIYLHNCLTRYPQIWHLILNLNVFMLTYYGRSIARLTGSQHWFHIHTLLQKNCRFNLNAVGVSFYLANTFVTNGYIHIYYRVCWQYRLPLSSSYTILIFTHKYEKLFVSLFFQAAADQTIVMIFSIGLVCHTKR